MPINPRPWLRASLLVTLLLAISPLAGAQKASKPRPEGGAFDGAVPAQRGTPGLADKQRAVPERQQRALASDSVEDQDVPPIDRELNEALIRTRRELLRQAINRMHQGSSPDLSYIWREIIPFLVFVVIAGALLWILHVILENRRWYKMVQVQSETHTKLLEKFGSSQDMLAYMESEAGRRFLERPLFNIEQKQVARFPYGRILWSVQIGLVMGLLGSGLLFLQGRGKVSPDAGTALQILGTMALAIGIGFVLSAVVSYTLSKRLGLFEGSKASLSRSEQDLRVT
ncbi:MAG TPA: hypothetical protein VOA41_16740 [Candidatus Dormibacteraeota bacterium]|nr:hypothetical protein [Candidatus Dormibacteraeota bacterium]